MATAACLPSGLLSQLPKPAAPPSAHLALLGKRLHAQQHEAESQAL